MTDSEYSFLSSIGPLILGSNDGLLAPGWNGGLLGTVLKVAKPLVSKFGGGLLSKEILDEIEQHMRTKYGAVGRGINSMMTEIMSKLGVTVDDICK